MTTRVNWNEPYDVLVTRPSPFSNPYSHKEHSSAQFKVNTKREAVDKFREHFYNNPELQEACKVLKNRRIACVCPSGTYCHADVFVDFLNRDDTLEEIFG